MRFLAIAIGLGCCSSLRAQSVAPQARADTAQVTLVSPAEYRRLGAEVRAALLASPEQFAQDRYSRLAELQAARGDLEGAKETARQGRSWPPFGRIAIGRYKAGDLAGAIAITRLAETAADRSQALGYLATVMPLDEGLDLVRQMEWPKQQIETLRSASRELLRTDTARSIALLHEAIGIAQRDTSFWGGYFTVDLAYDLAARGDLRGALRIVSDTLIPRERVQRIARIATELQRAPTPGARPLADSLFREAVRAAAQFADTADRTRQRRRAFESFGRYATGSSLEVMRAEARTPAELALVQASTPFTSAFAPVSRNNFPDSLRTLYIRDLDAAGRHRKAADELQRFVSEHVYRSRTSSPDAEQRLLDSLARRAVEEAGHVSEGFADTTRYMLVLMTLRVRSATAEWLADAIRVETLRWRSALLVARRMFDVDPQRAFVHAAQFPVAFVQDSLLAYAAAQTSYASAERGAAFARRIAAPNLRGISLLTVAGRAAERGDTTQARALTVESIAQYESTVPPIASHLLVGLVRAGLYGDLLAWARSQTVPESRARVFFALFGAVASN
jgi:hypothetical protein